MHEHKILSACLKNRKTWELVNEHGDKDFSPEGGIIYGLIAQFYGSDAGAKNCDIEILAARAGREVSSSKIAEIVVQGIRTLDALDVSAINIGEEILSLRRSVLASKLSAALSTNRSAEEVNRLINEYQQVSVQSKSESGGDEIYTGVKASDLTQSKFSKENLIHVFPKVLDDHLDGGLRGGHHILVFAPTEMGKSLFAINLCYGFLKQGLRVLYVGNEDPAADIIMRMMTRLTLMNKYEIAENPEKADEILARRNWDQFIFYNASPGTFEAIRKQIGEVNPAVVILDQLRNIDVASESRVQALERAATEARNTAKRFNIPVVSVTQAADSASGKKVLDRGDVDYSNVGIPGQCDVMIGIGATSDMEEMNMRMLSFPKNKLSGRHQPIPIQIDPLTSRVIENG